MDQNDVLGSTDIVYVPDWPDQSRRRLLSQDWPQPRITSLAEALGVGTQALEDVTFDVLLSFFLSNATGAQLDSLGRIVGELRGAADDGDYRRFIGARILINISQGSPDELIGIFKVLTDGDVEYLPMFPAGYTLQVVRKSFLSERARRRVRRMMGDCRVAGVTMELIEALPGPFAFVGNLHGPAGYDRGYLARVL